MNIETGEVIVTVKDWLLYNKTCVMINEFPNHHLGVFVSALNYANHTTFVGTIMDECGVVKLVDEKGKETTFAEIQDMKLNLSLIDFGVTE